MVPEMLWCYDGAEFEVQSIALLHWVDKSVDTYLIDLGALLE